MKEATLDIFMNHQVTFWRPDSEVHEYHKLVVEEPLFIHLHNRPIYTTMRTPGDEIALAAGFCLSQGIINHPDDVESFDFDDKTAPNLVNVTLKSSARGKTGGRYKEGFEVHEPDRGCAERLIDELFRSVGPASDNHPIDIARAFECIDTLSDHQELRRFTRASHAAAAYSSHYDLLSVSEDVGRHNALDKSIGKLLLSGGLPQTAFLALSSRISFELVQKAARAHIPTIISVSRPTAFAVRLASKLNMTLACLAKGPGLYIFCGHHRLTDS